MAQKLINWLLWACFIGAIICFIMAWSGCTGSKNTTTQKNKIDSTGNSAVKVTKWDSAASKSGVSITHKGQTVIIDSGNTMITIDQPVFSGNGQNLFDVLVKADRVTIRDNRRQSVKSSSLSLLIDSSKGFVKSRTDSTARTVTKVKKQETTIQAEKKNGFPWWLVIIAGAVAAYFVIKNAL